MTTQLARPEPSFAPAMPMRTIDDAAAWRGSDFSDGSAYTHRLTEAEIAEIDAAVAAVAERGVDHAAIDRGSFPLAQFGKYLTSVRDDVLLRGRGFIVIRGLPVERYSMSEAAT